ncbi:MAG: hypothetical protein NW226_12580 [Microscillaceae bacterium]|nr:hypothetical protein [Microscillaceae bacterium]
MYLKLLKILSWVLLLFGASACIQDNLNYVVHSRGHLVRQLEKLEAKNNRFYNYAKGRLTAIDRLVNQGNEGFQSTPRKWNNYILKIKYEYESFRQELNAVEFKSKDFFINMNKVVKHIAQADIRKKEMETHSLIKKNWNSNHKSIVQKLDSINCMIEVTFPDFHKILLGSNMHGKKKYSVEFSRLLLDELEDIHRFIKIAIEKQRKLILDTELEEPKTTKKEAQTT